MPSRDVLTKADLAELRRTALGTADPLGERDTTADPEVGPPDAPGVLFLLLQQRHRVRRNPNLPHDRQDDLADRLENQLVRQASERQGGTSDLLLWPRDEFDRLLAAHPELTDAAIRAGYAAEVSARPAARVPWPPERNDACWCGSGLKYKKDCLPRSRS
ncbi:SEC-C domain-containing protein [Micromonospora sp. NPDC049102]|uniref:SEC-C domain-containing protein n=1 Tax=Micromonospora sp. NPDC049102 TaxID=3364265 RepID=UPI0037180D8D